ncbi:MAG: lipocalin family protein [Agitococcus sp.]|nr:lipocalin family protein [Agitococcus sp.]
MIKYLLVIICFFISPSWANTPLQTVPQVDLARYMGKWYEIARIPNPFQKSCLREVTANYSLLANNHVRGMNTCRKASGELFSLAVDGKVQDKTNAKLVFKITSSWLSWIPMLKADYWIVDLADNYSYAAVATPDSHYLWILARQPQMDDTVYQQLIKRVAKQGFAVEKLVKNKI